MDTTATVFGISADNARTIGKYSSWIWVFIGLGLIPVLGPYTYLVILANFLHFNSDLAVRLGEYFDYRVTIEDINFLGMLAYEFFLQVAILSAIVALIALDDASLWIPFAVMFFPWLALFLEELTAPYITYSMK